MKLRFALCAVFASVLLCGCSDAISKEQVKNPETPTPQTPIEVVDIDTGNRAYVLNEEEKEEIKKDDMSAVRQINLENVMDELMEDTDVK